MTQIEFNKALKSIERDMRRQAAADVRKRWRDEQGLIYVKTYTVKSHLRRRKPKRPRLVSVPATVRHAQA